MLIWNRFVLKNNPQRDDCGYPFMGLHTNFFRANNLSRYYGETWHDAADKSSTPSGANPPYQLMLAPKAGGMGTTGNTVAGTGDFTGNMAAGKNMEVTIPCTGTLTASQLQTVISMVATLAATGTISNAQLVSFVNMVATIGTTGSFTANIGALSNLVATLQAVASMSPQMNATANMEADITPFTELSPENLAAAVWNAIASAYNDSGTMGQKLNGAGSAGDPWTTDLSAYNTANTAGKVLKDAQKKAKGAYLNTI